MTVYDLVLLVVLSFVAGAGVAADHISTKWAESYGAVETGKIATRFGKNSTLYLRLVLTLLGAYAVYADFGYIKLMGYALMLWIGYLSAGAAWMNMLLADAYKDDAILNRWYKWHKKGIIGKITWIKGALSGD